MPISDLLVCVYYEAISEVVQPTRRRHSKEKVIRAAMQSNVSIAAAALHYQLNANLLRRWGAAREEQDVAREARQSMSAPPAQFVPLQPEAPDAVHSSQEIQIEARRGAATITVRWPGCAAADCAVWLQRWLRSASSRSGWRPSPSICAPASI